jgi:beta-phosphoglucomutase-like phosphatase (HAD superfamily)
VRRHSFKPFEGKIFTMSGLYQDSIITPQLNAIISKSEIVSWDFEGASIATEVVMQGSFKKSLDENGVSSDRYGNIYEIEKETSGRTLVDIFTDFKDKYNLGPSVEQLLDRRRQLYVEMVDQHQLTLFPFVAPIARLAKDKGAKQFFLSNGDHKVILDISSKAGVYPDPISHIYASNSPERLEFEEKHGPRSAGNKGVFLAEYSIEKMVPPYKIVLVEDNPKHINKIQEEMKAAWQDLLSRKSAAFKFGLTEDTIGEVQEIYVENEFNVRHGFTPNTGIVFQGLAPKPLCDELGITSPPSRGTALNGCSEGLRNSY